MAMTLRWVDENELDRVAETRTYSYAPSIKDVDTFKQQLREDKRAKVGDFLLAESDGVAVGTTTSLSLNMWVRGSRIPAQGVAYVGTIKTHRRRRGEKGIATQLMHETLRKARERGDVVSALMPFRSSFYEHFGYGIVERRNEWTLPMSVLPQGDFDGMRFMREEDLPLMEQCRQKMVERGQCDFERTSAGWATYRSLYPQGYFVVDQPTAGAAIRSYLHLVEINKNGQRFAQVVDAAWDSQESFQRQLYFLASLCDQYAAAVLILPADFRMNWLLRERQIPNWPDRPITHRSARLQSLTRMQLRILDHVKFLESLNLPTEVSGRATISIRESEGTLSSLKIECEAGRISAKPHSGNADFECADTIWAAIACGDLTASAAARHGLIRITEPAALKVLDALSIGPAPFSNEYF